MLRVIVQSPPKPIGDKGWQQQVVGVFCMESPGVEAAFPVPVPMLVGIGEKGYAPGEYRLDPSSIQPKADTYGKLFLTATRLVLNPFKGKQ